MDLNGFLKALGDFPDSIVGASVSARASLWNQEARRAGDTVTPKCLMSRNGERRSPWCSEELRSMKWNG